MTADARAVAAEALRVVDAEPTRAWELAGTAIALAKPRREHGTVAVAERARGLAALHLAHVDTSVEHLTAAVAAARRGDDPLLVGEVRMSLAGALNRRGASRRARTVIEQALDDLTGAPRARALAQRGAILQQLGRLDAALADYREALPALRAGGDGVWVQRVLSNRGVLRTYRRELDAAAGDLHEAARLCRQLGLDLQLAFCQENLGFVDTRRGDVPAALSWFADAERSYRRLGASIGSLLVDRCELLLSVRLVHEAREAAEQAVAEFSGARRGLQLPEAQLLLSEAALLDGDPGRAEQVALSAGRSFRRQDRPGRQALARYAALKARLAQAGGAPVRVADIVTLAATLERAGSPSAALDARLRAAQLAHAAGRDAVASRELTLAAAGRRRGPAALRAQAWHAEALRRFYDARYPGALRAIEAGLRILDEQRAALGAADLRAHASGHRADLTGLGLRIAVGSDDPRRVLAWSELGRSAALVRPARPPADPVLADLLVQLRSVVAELGEANRAGLPATPILRRQLGVEAAIRDRTRRRPGGTSNRFSGPDPEAVGERLGDDALVEFFSLDGMLGATTVVSGRTRLHRLRPLAEVQVLLDQIPFALRRLAHPRSAGQAASALRLLRHAAGRLDDALLRPLRPDVQDRSVVVVPTGPLQSVPWSLLPAARGRAVSVAPSAALWLEAARRPPATGAVVLAAGPGLPGARREIEQIAPMYQDPIVLADDGCSTQALIDAMQRSRLAHLSAHGDFRADNPLFSSLLLADGPLTGYDLESLRRVPSVVVLAACDSAQSLVCAGDELLGLASSFLSLGTSALVGSVVPVPDIQAASLMTTLHRHLARGLSVASALAEAQGAVDSDDGAAVAAASGFICLGAGDLVLSLPQPRDPAGAVGLVGTAQR
jgi:tetratricopeptide (TPR) repeat protein